MADSLSNVPTLETVLTIWPVANALANHLPVGDLINLSRLSTSLRTTLHGFPEPTTSTTHHDSHESSSSMTSCSPSLLHTSHIRQSLRIGRHCTPTWTTLKSASLFLCSDPAHTQGHPPRPCVYCSKPVCTACIVRSSVSRGHENTFANRVRYLCDLCWDNGVPSKSTRFPLMPVHHTEQQKEGSFWTNGSLSSKDCNWPTDTDFCTCTLLRNGHICTPCKDAQNYSALTHASTTCHGQNCSQSLPPDKPTHRICLWCEHPLPRAAATPRHAWNAKLFEARARNAASRSADIEEWNRKRLASMRMSRREMRGDDLVGHLTGQEADRPCLVRHLDTINYRKYMRDGIAPSGAEVYDSKRGYWRYNRDFLLTIGRLCHKVAVPPELEPFVADSQTGRFARTNRQKEEDLQYLPEFLPDLRSYQHGALNALKPQILERHADGLASEVIAGQLNEQYGLDLSADIYQTVLDRWNTNLMLPGNREKGKSRATGYSTWGPGHSTQRARGARNEQDRKHSSEADAENCSASSAGSSKSIADLTGSASIDPRSSRGGNPIPASQDTVPDLDDREANASADAPPFHDRAEDEELSTEILAAIIALENNEGQAEDPPPYSP